MIILIMGPQGSGKGTQAKRLANEFNMFYLDVGKELRKIAKNDPRINEIVNKRGELMPDDEIFKIVAKILSDNKYYDNLILDGYPRSIVQYKYISRWFAKHGSSITKAIYLKVSDKVSIKRLEARRIDTKTGVVYNLLTNPPPQGINPKRLIQREDDTPEAIKERLVLYHKVTEPLVNLLRKEGKLVEVNGEREVDEIYKEIRQLVTAQ